MLLHGPFVGKPGIITDVDDEIRGRLLERTDGQLRNQILVTNKQRKLQGSGHGIVKRIFIVVCLAQGLTVDSLPGPQ
tara:strand:+ start:1424 stop:1654 length:231 start_codon:yes stop_codon:yes gene_type:complete